MYIRRAIIAATFFFAISPTAHAKEELPPAPLFDDYAAHTEGSREARTALSELARHCDFSEFSRVGPSPEEAAACEKSVKVAVALSSRVVPDALRALNEASLGYTGRVRTYDVLARVGDLRAVQSLISALPKLEGHRRVRAERRLVLSTLSRLSYAKVGEQAPFVEHDDDDRAITSAWQTWLIAHRGMSRDELLQERLADARAHAQDPDEETAFLAASFLYRQKPTRKEGLSAFDALMQRPQLSTGAVEAIRQVLGAMPRAKTAPERKPKAPPVVAPTLSLLTPPSLAP